MIKHSFKLIWNQKRKNAYIILELFLLFIVLLTGSIYLIEKYELYTGGVGANIEDTFFMGLMKKDFQRGDYAVVLKNMHRELESLPDVKKVSYSYQSIPYIWSMSSSSMNYDSNYITSVVRAVDENFANVFDLKIIAGSWLEDDYLGANPPIVVDVQVANKLFGTTENAIGKTVTFNGDKQVVGVFQMLKRNEYEENYPACFMPINTKSVYGIDIVLKYKQNTTPNPSQLAQIVHSYFDKNDFAIRYVSTLEAKKAQVNAATHIEIVMVSIFAVFLVINIVLGMIGIFGYNVKVRKSELGLRRAVGSSAFNIYLLLMLESWALTLMALIPAILLMIQVPLLDLYPVDTYLFTKSLGLSIVLIFLLVSISVYYPAYLASKMQTAESLQEE
ncbi:MAG: ABC transporter permease [Bacteroidales bacterium]|nr:ABC transporter permease [Bacteroidales bacterium]